MKSIIVEDESVAAQRLQRMLNETGQSIENLAIFESVEEIARYLLTNEHPDILFLDIEVADGNIFELFKILEVKSKVIFTTAYSEFGAAAFRKNAVDYLLKPIKLEELKEAISKVKGQLTTTPNTPFKVPLEYKDRFLIKFGSKFTIVKTLDIAYIYSENKIVYFYLNSGIKVASDYKLQDLEEMVDPKLFFRVNRQFIIHIDAITSMNTYTKARVNLKLRPEFKEDIIVSTEKTPEFKEWLQGHNKSM
jgi:two-component system, LytTR family, response regulator LytT